MRIQSVLEDAGIRFLGFRPLHVATRQILRLRSSARADPGNMASASFASINESTRPDSPIQNVLGIPPIQLSRNVL